MTSRRHVDGGVGGRWDAALTRGDGRRYGTRSMARERPVDAFAKKLLHAIEISLTATDAARDAVQEILRRGAETGIFFAGTRRGDTTRRSS